MISTRALDENVETSLEKFARSLLVVGCLTVPLLDLRLIGNNVTVSDALFGLSIVILLLTGARKVVPPSGTRQIAAALCLFGGLTAQFMTPDMAGNLSVVGRVLFIILVWPWLAGNLLVDRGLVERAANFWAAGCVAFALVTILQSGSAPGDNTSGRLQGLATHVTDAGGVLSIAFPFLLGAVIARPRKWLTVPALAAVGVALVLTGSISGVITAGLSAVLLLLAFRGALRLKAALWTAVLGAAAISIATKLQTASNLSSSLSSRLQSTTGGTYDTFSWRMQTWQYAIHSLSYQPLIGQGLDGPSGFTVLDLDVHNMLLLAWYQGGLLFFAGLVLFLVHVYQRSKLVPASDALGKQLKVSAIAAFMFSMTSPLMAQRYLWLPVILLIALTYHYERAPAKVTANPTASSAP